MCKRCVRLRLDRTGLDRLSIRRAIGWYYNWTICIVIVCMHAACNIKFAGRVRNGLTQPTDVWTLTARADVAASRGGKSTIISQVQGKRCLKLLLSHAHRTTCLEFLCMDNSLRETTFQFSRLSRAALRTRQAKKCLNKDNRLDSYR